MAFLSLLQELMDNGVKDAACYMLDKLRHIVVLARGDTASDDLLLLPFNVCGASPTPQSWFLPGAGSNNAPTSLGPVLRRQFTMFHYPREVFAVLLDRLFPELDVRAYTVVACGGNRVHLRSKRALVYAPCHSLVENVILWHTPADVASIQNAGV